VYLTDLSLTAVLEAPLLLPPSLPTWPLPPDEVKPWPETHCNTCSIGSGKIRKAYTHMDNNIITLHIQQCKLTPWVSRLTRHHEYQQSQLWLHSIQRCNARPIFRDMHIQAVIQVMLQNSCIPKDFVFLSHTISISLKISHTGTDTRHNPTCCI
jgi:hypothetical protein